MSLAKPCPSCGSLNHELRFNTETGDYYVECRACHMTGSRKESPATAITSWNELPRFHEVPRAPGEFWKETLSLLRECARFDSNAQMEQVLLRLDVLEQRVGSLDRLITLFQKCREVDAICAAGGKTALGNLGEALESYEEKVRKSI